MLPKSFPVHGLLRKSRVLQRCQGWGPELMPSLPGPVGRRSAACPTWPGDSLRLPLWDGAGDREVRVIRGEPGRPVWQGQPHTSQASGARAARGQPLRRTALSWRKKHLEVLCLAARHRSASHLGHCDFPTGRRGTSCDTRTVGGGLYPR